MSTEKSPVSTSDHAPTRWAIVGSFVVAWSLAIVLLFSDIVKVLATRPWWEEFIVAVATAAVPILAFLELRHSGEANRMRGEANEERRKANRLTEENAQLAAELNRHVEQIAINTARPTQPPSANLKIYPANRSRYILKPAGPGGAHGDFKGGHFQFWLRVENSGNRNSAVDKYKIWIQEFDRDFDGIVPKQPFGLVPGRHCQHGVGNEKYLNEANLIKIPADDSTNVGVSMVLSARTDLGNVRERRTANAWAGASFQHSSLPSDGNRLEWNFGERRFRMSRGLGLPNQCLTKLPPSIPPAHE